MSSFSPHKLNECVPWSRLLHLLGLPVPTQLLPAITRCPLCHKHRLTIYNDKYCGGQWFYCPDCKKSGDLIQLASKTWGLSLAATIVKLAHNDFDITTEDEPIRQYLRLLVERRRTAAVFWKDARHRPLHSSTTAGRLTQELRLVYEVSATRAELGPKRLLGLSTRDLAEQLRKPDFGKVTTYSGGEHRAFTGLHWQDVLVVPYRDLPGRCCGFLCIGRDGDPQKDFVYQHAGLPTLIDQESREAGLAMHPDVTEVSTHWEHTVVAVNDAVRMLQMQFRHFEQSTEPLPLVAWYSQHGRANLRTEQAWQMLQGKSLVFWMPHADAETLRQAIQQDAKISTLGPARDDASSWREYLWKFTPRELTRKVIAAAEPWSRVLARLAETETDAVVEELFLRLKLNGLRLDLVLQQCTNTTRRRVKALLQSLDMDRTLRLNGQTVVERQDVWYVSRDSREELIIDAVLRITEVIHHSQAKLVYYRGYIKYQGQRVAFCEPKARIERDVFQWMQARVLAADLGHLRFNPSRSRQAIAIATQFRQPLFTRGTDTIGWQAKTDTFVLPNFSIEPGGRVTGRDTTLLPGKLPGRTLPKPEDLSGLDAHWLLQDKHTSRLMWATVLPILGNILAPACAEQTTGIGLYGCGAAEMGEVVATTLGCDTYTLNSRRDLELLTETEHRHNWPALIDHAAARNRTFFRDWLDNDRKRPHSAIAELNWWQYSLKAATGRWTMVVSDRPAKLDEDTHKALQKFMSAYLRDVMSRRMQITHWRVRDEVWLHDLARDVQNFLKPLSDNHRRVTESLTLLRPYRDSGSADDFAAVLAGLLTANRLSLGRQGYEQPGRRQLLQSDAGLFVPRAVLFAALRDCKLSLPDPHKLGSVLSQAGVLVAEQPDGWLINEPWLWENKKRQQPLLTEMLRGGKDRRATTR